MLKSVALTALAALPCQAVQLNTLFGEALGNWFRDTSDQVQGVMDQVNESIQNTEDFMDDF